METHTDKIQQTLEKNQETQTRAWADLPQDILELILRKLHSVDKIRFRAVCKNWLIPRDWMKKYKDHLPWACNLSWENSSVECKLYDPHSRKVIKVSNSVEKRMNLKGAFDDTIVCGSKQGWLLVGCDGQGSSLFMCNPFINEVILLPYLRYKPSVATFSANPASVECEVFVFCRDEDSDAVFIASYCLSRDATWSIKFLEMTRNECGSMHFMDGKLFCLFEEAVLKSYALAEKSWTLLVPGFTDVDPRYRWMGWCSLFENKGDLLMACSDDHCGICHIFSLDWSNMSWDVATITSLESIAFYISGKITMTTPLVDDDYEYIKDCRMFYLDRYCLCESIFTAMTIESHGYDRIDEPCSNMAFIEAPYN